MPLPTSTVPAVANAISSVADLVKEIVHEDQRELIDRDRKERIASGNQARGFLLAGRLASLRLVTDQFLPAAFVELSEADFSKLDSICFSVRGTDLLGLVCQGLLAQHQARIVQVIQTAPRD